MRSLAWPHAFVPHAWATLHGRYEDLAAGHPEFGYLLDIVSSVEGSGCQGQLAATTSMHDLLIVATPVPDPPMEVVVVRTPSSLTPPPAGCVTIEHLAHSGRNDSIQRPAEEAVPLFWRFVLEKLGVTVTGQ